MNNYKLIEKENKYFIYEGDKEYLTPILLPIVTSDKGLAEAILHKMNDGEQEAVKQYLDKYNSDELTNMILELASADPYYSDNEIKMYFKHCKEYIEDSHLKLLIDGYSECGSVLAPFILGTFDVYDEDINFEYDPFLYAMAASSGTDISALNDSLTYTLDPIYDALDNDDFEQVSEEFLLQLCEKYNATLLPSDEEDRNTFFDTING